jgi:HD superfamily phosphodiesterase
MVASEGVDERVVSMIQRHVGAGISKEEADSLGFPPSDYIPRTLEEKVVCFSDKMVDLDRVRSFGEEVNRFRKKGHDVKRLEELKRSIQTVLGEDPERVIFSKL